MFNNYISFDLIHTFPIYYIHTHTSVIKRNLFNRKYSVSLKYVRLVGGPLLTSTLRALLRSFIGQQRTKTTRLTNVANCAVACPPSLLSCAIVAEIVDNELKRMKEIININTSIIKNLWQVAFGDMCDNQQS